MSQQMNSGGLSGRALALARRKALSGAGKRAETGSTANRTRGESLQRQAAVSTQQPPASAPAPAQTQPRQPQSSESRFSAPASAKSRSRQSATPAVSSSRSTALARRQAMSSMGKVAASSQGRVRDAGRSQPSVTATSSKAAGRDCGCGCNGAGGVGSCQQRTERPAIGSRAASDKRGKLRAPRRSDAAKNTSRAVSLARRRAQSSRGKAGISASGMTPAQTARAGNPELSSRELAHAVREQRSKRGGAGVKKSAPTGRLRPTRATLTQGPSQDQPWKVGLGETSHGQSVTGTMVGRKPEVTGDEASTCRTITGSEYLGADIFRDFCQAELPKSVLRSGNTSTSSGNRVTGNEVSRFAKVTGNESGGCKQVTGTEYLSVEESQQFCGVALEKGPSKVTSAETRGGKSVTGSSVGRSKRVTGDEVGASRSLTGTQYLQRPADDEQGFAPPKVGRSATLRGGAVSGTMVGRHQAMSGDELGSCRNVTGDDYVGQEQFSQFCAAIPEPQDRKVGLSTTLGGERVTGTLTGRGSRVTGDEPGSCKSVTGTPYAGSEQYAQFCESSQTNSAKARMQPSRRPFGVVMSGIQPSVGGKLSGDQKGACEPVSGTPYVGVDQVAEICPAVAAEMSSPDFPQPLEAWQAWGQFSIESPQQAAAVAPPKLSSSVTGAVGDSSQITGSFGKANGKLTGTDEARFSRRSGSTVSETPQEPQEPPMVSGRIKSRVSGEGIDTGCKITGDDWDRGDRVTGTEGTSALARNPSRRGPPLPMASAMANGRPEAVPQPVSKVTGSSGNTEQGSLITYSGGARG